MRIFKDPVEAVKEIERDLWELGAICKTKSVQDERGDFETRELIGYQYMVPCDSEWEEHEPEAMYGALAEFFKVPLNELEGYLSRETQERMEFAVNPGTAWEFRKETWEKYLHDGRFSYTYPERIWDPTNQLGHCYQVLTSDPNSRQAIVQIYDKHKDWSNTGGRARIPCSLTYQFLSRASDEDRSLHCIYTMRSCDFYKHFVYDMCLARNITCHLANRLGWRYGNLIMQIGSFHAFKEDLDKRRIF